MPQTDSEQENYTKTPERTMKNGRIVLGIVRKHGNNYMDKKPR